MADNNIRQFKRLSQVFLNNHDLIRRIVDNLSFSDQEAILEIGGGDGRVSELLQNCGSRLIIVELDDRFAARLVEKFADNPRVEIINGDILAPETIASVRTFLGEERCHIYGSIPYHITTPIMKWIIANRDIFVAANLLMQKEVADRVVARPGSKDYGYTSVQMQLAASVSLGTYVPREAFSPIPRVDSQVLNIDLSDQPEPMDAKCTRMISMVFQQRRKQFSNTLKRFLERDLSEAEIAKLAEIDVKLTDRPESIAPEKFQQMFDCLD
jgi:16S rRNA (adenine1518-N6/adenine1519-N6)-dimethyltransferase